ncbi:MAG: HAMP domain-containing histidine kinase, partial [Bradyrhizobium sp.]|nr:HAMP domain-containing histidine kinase [Bradyrhizobium sp.]
YRITEADRRANRIRDDVLTYSGVLLFVATLVAVMVAIAASRSILAPIHHLVEATEAVARGDWERRIDENRRDEFGRLAESFNRMTAELKDQQQKILQEQKMASIGRLAAGVAHEINNPIGVILGYAKMIRASQEFPEDVAEDLQAIEEEAVQCKDIVENLLNFSRPAPPSDTVVNLAALTNEVLDRAQPDAAVLGVKITRQLPDQLTLLRADTTRLRQVVRNIVHNALDAMGDGDELQVTLQRL